MTVAAGTLGELRDRLVRWAVEDAFPLWATAGRDDATGGFQEALTADGAPAPRPRRDQRRGPRAGSGTTTASSRR